MKVYKKLYTHTHNASHDILSQKLVINLQKENPNTGNQGYIKLVDYSQINNWDAKMIDGANLSFLCSKIYKNVRLNTLVKINPRTTIPKDTDITFVPMENVSEVYGEIKYNNCKNSNQSKGYTKFKDNDIAWAKITPCMENGKSFIANELENGYGIGSTEFHIIRNISENILDNRFLFHILRSNAVRENATHYFTGTAGQKRVKKEFLEDLLIPLPSLDTQKEIAKQIDLEIQSIKDIELEIQNKQKQKNEIISLILEI